MQLHHRIVESSFGARAGQVLVRAGRGPVLSSRSLALVRFDLARLDARRSRRGERYEGDLRQLHLGCGKRRIEGWLNIDVAGSDFDVDLGRMPLPFVDDAFDVVVSQQVIEHLDLDDELFPLMRELARVVTKGGTLWLSCPDMAKVCRAYVEDRGVGLVADKQARNAYDPTLGVRPSQIAINWAFHQAGEHKNLFDLELLQWMADEVGFSECVEVDEATLLAAHPGFPARNDGFQSIYVRITV